MNQTSSGSGSKSRSMSNAMTLRVVTISVVQCVSVGPYSIAVLIPEFMNNVDKNYAITCLLIIFTFIWFINHACNFILYSIFGNAFRRDFKQLFYKRRHKPVASSVIGSDSRVHETEQLSVVSYSSKWDTGSGNI